MTVSTGLLADLSSLGPLYARITNWWNQDITDWAVDANNAALITAAVAVNELSGRMHPDFNNVDTGKPYGIPFGVADKNTPRYAVDFSNKGESDLGPYPIPEEAKTNLGWIENRGRTDGDRHMLLFDKDNRICYELYQVGWDGTKWYAGSGAIFDMKNDVRRREGWTSADAAGLSILAGLIRYDEVYGPNEIEHSLRFCLKQNNYYVYPASHDNGIYYPGAPPLGSRLRLKPSFDTVNIIGGGTFSAGMQKILRCLKIYGGLMADRGGGFFFQGTLDPRWTWLGPEFHKLHITDFEFVALGDNPGQGIYKKKIVPSLD